MNEIWVSFWKHRELIRQLVLRDVIGRYRGSYVGVTWSVIYPLMMLGTYTFVFGVLLRPTWLPTTSPFELALFIFVGLIAFNFFAECVSRAPSVLLQNPGFVKKVRFPLEVLSWVTVLSALVHALLAFLVLFILCLFGWHPLNATMLLFPLVLLMMLPLLLGLCWMLSTVGVFVRDLSHAIGFIVQALGFLSPLFYSLDVAPPVLRTVILAGPVAIPIETARAIVLSTSAPSWSSIAIYLVASIAMAMLGIKWFQFARREFADAL